MIQALIAELWPYLVGVAGVIAGLFYARQSGKRQGRSELKREIDQDRQKSREAAREVDQQISSMDDDSVVRGLDRWVRSNRKR